MKLPRELIDYILKIRTRMAWEIYLARVHRKLDRRVIFSNFAEIHFRGELVFISRSKYNEFTVEVSHVVNQLPLLIEKIIIRRVILIKTDTRRKNRLYYRSKYLPSIQILREAPFEEI